MKKASDRGCKTCRGVEQLVARRANISKVVEVSSLR